MLYNCVSVYGEEICHSFATLLANHSACIYCLLLLAISGIAEFAGLEFAGLENDGLENDGVEQKQTHILHTIK